jgi:competence protein ComEA
MNRLLVFGAAAVAAVLALHHPSFAPAAAAFTTPRPAGGFHSRPPVRRPAALLAVVYVAGAVPHPGLYRLPLGARVDDAVRKAGGFLAAADPVAVNLAEHVSDGEEIRVPQAGEATPRPARTRRAHAKRTRSTSAPSQTIDLNSANASALASLPGIGEILAERIIEYRRVNGPFASLDELADVAGMTQRRIDAIAPFVVAATTH